MINSLKISGFKSFVNEDLALSQLTLLAGLNSSGKSSIVQALRMHNAALTVGSPLLFGHGGIDELRSKFVAPKDSILIQLTLEDGSKSTLTLPENDPASTKTGPEFFYIGADRLGPQPNLPIEQSLNTSPRVGDKGEYVFDFITRLVENNYVLPENLYHENAQGVTFEHILQGWLSEISPDVNFTFQRNNKADISHAEIDTFRPTNVGFGLSYTLPIIAAALGAAATPAAPENNEPWVTSWEARKKKNGVLLVLENPEAHLHPRGQTAMGKLLALCAAAGIQVIVETHSEHVMDGIRIAIKQKSIDNKKVKFHYFTKIKNKPSIVQSPNINQDAKLDFWPEGFFDQTLKNRAILARRS